MKKQFGAMVMLVCHRIFTFIYEFLIIVFISQFISKTKIAVVIKQMLVAYCGTEPIN